MNERTAASQDKQATEPSNQLSGAFPPRGPVAGNEHYAMPVPGSPLAEPPGADTYARPRLGYHFGQLQVHASTPSETYAEIPASRPADGYEQEANRAAEQVVHVPEAGGSEAKEEPLRLSRTEPAIQRAALEGEATPPTSDMGATTGDSSRLSDTAADEPAADTAPPGLIVEDSAAELGPGEMRKSKFLSQLRDAVCTTAEEALAGTEWSAAGCPWIDYWFGYYGNRDTRQIERAIRRYAPDTAGATTAGAYIPAITQRVRSAIAAWATTGKVTGVPEVVPAEPSGTAPAGGAAPAAGSVMFKGRNSSARHASEPQALQAQLGSGNSFAGGVRSRMERVFGQDFSQVRVHTDSKASELSGNLNARAFAVGKHIAFGAGKYRPGTPIGDALIAHELAHVVQQGGSRPSTPFREREAPDADLEEDADLAAMGAVSSIWLSPGEALRRTGPILGSRLRSGLRLQRCTRDSGPATTAAAVPPHPTLADKAESLGGETLTMDSYRKYQDKTWTWFFSPNTGLAGRAGKPAQVNNWADWRSMHWQSRQVLADLAGLDASTLAQNNTNLQKLKQAYADWPADKFAVFQSGTTATNTCNVFLGDSLFLDGKNQIKDGKYYSAASVYAGEGGFTVIDRSQVARGDIAAWGAHVEIVTSANLGGDSFCSRGGFREPMGGEKCADSSRKISNPRLRFLRVRP